MRVHHQALTITRLTELELYESYELMRLPLDEEEPLVEGLLTARDKVLFVGKEKVGKSIWGQQLAHCVAGGLDFIGFRVPEAKVVLYVAGEGDLDELQSRGKAMRRALLERENRLWYWSIPPFQFNTPAGFQTLMQAAEKVSVVAGCFPHLTIVDPVFAVFKGSMSEDEAVNEFVRSLNRYQAVTHGAVVVTHHTHRIRRKMDGEVIAEGDDAVLGSTLWKAWPRKVFLMTLNADKSRTWSSETERKPTALNEHPLKVTLVEPSPLLFVRWQEGVTPTMAAVVELLKMGRALTATEIVSATQKSTGSVSDALTRLVATESIKVVEDSWPKAYGLG